MNPKTREALEKFAAEARWKTGSPIVNESFFDFVITAYRYSDSDIPIDEFLAVLNTKSEARGEINVSEKKRQLGLKMFLFNKYEDGIRILRRFEEASPVSKASKAS